MEATVLLSDHSDIVTETLRGAGLPDSGYWCRFANTVLEIRNSGLNNNVLDARYVPQSVLLK